MNHDSFLFIQEESWRNFTEQLIGSVIICGYGQAIYHDIIFEGKNTSHALCLLCVEICKQTNKDPLLVEFIKKQCNV